MIGLPARPLVTVVTPSFNQGRFIRQTIESVLSQDYQNVEYIVMDGGSTDETASVVREYEGRLTFFSEKDRGQSDAINKGFRMARGEIVAWLNSDDVFLPGAISHAVRTLQECPSAGAVYGEGYLIDREGNVKGRFPATEPFNLWKLVYASDYVLQQTVFFRRSVFDEIGFLNEHLHWGMDWDILIRIGKRFGLEYIPAYMGCLREYGEAKTFSGGSRRFRELARILREHGEQRYPPGFITYGLDTYQNIVCAWIGRLTPGFLARPSRFVQRCVSYAAHRVIANVLRECQGLYSDSWAGPRLRYMLPSSTSRLIRMEGLLPDVGPALRGQILEVLCNGRIVCTAALNEGEFAVEFAVEPTGSPLAMEVRAAKWLIPAQAGLGPDSRKLSFILRAFAGADQIQTARSATA